MPESKLAADAAASPLPLDGVNVVECGEEVSAAFAAKLLAMLGASVVKVEPPQGDIARRRGPFPGGVADPERSGLFLYLNADKRGVTLDLRAAEDRDKLDRLLAGADILVHNIPPARRAACRMDNREVAAAHPHLIVAGISAYGDFGPRANYRAYELQVMHSGGVGALGPMASPFPELPPLKIFGHQGDFQGGVHAAMAIMAAWWHRLKSGAGGQAIEVSEQECLVAMMELSLIYYAYGGARTSRLGHRSIGPWGIYDCLDGKIVVTCLEEAQWDRFVKVMGNPDWAGEEIFKDRLARGTNIDAIDLFIGEFTRNRKMLDLVRECQANNVPAAPVCTMADVYADEQLEQRQFMVPLPVRDDIEKPILVPGAGFKSDTMGWRFEKPAPRSGEHNRELAGQVLASAPRPGSRAASSSAGPLRGVRVLDFSKVWAGPMSTLQLAHLGAEVIRVESVKYPCLNRSIPPWGDGKPDINNAGSFNQWNQGKRSLQLDLTRPEAVAIALELAAHCDVAVESFAPGVIGRLGLGYGQLKARKPDIIMASLSGYGQTGPRANYVCYGSLTAAQSGLYSATGYPGDITREFGITYVDPTVGVFSAMLIAAALLHRERTGKGQYLDISMLEVLETMMPEALLQYAINEKEPEFVGNHDGLMSPHNCYQTLGGAEDWVAIAAGSEEEWRSLCAAMGKPSLAGDPRFRSAAMRKDNEEALDQIITEWTRGRDRWQITELLQAAGVSAIPVMGNQDIAEDAHLHERGFLVQLDHPKSGRHIHAGVPWIMSGTPCRIWRPAPILGQDTDYVLSSILGYPDGKIAHLRETGILT